MHFFAVHPHNFSSRIKKKHIGHPKKNSSKPAPARCKDQKGWSSYRARDARGGCSTARDAKLSRRAPGTRAARHFVPRDARTRKDGPCIGREGLPVSSTRRAAPSAGRAISRTRCKDHPFWSSHRAGARISCAHRSRAARAPFARRDISRTRWKNQKGWSSHRVTGIDIGLATRHTSRENLFTEYRRPEPRTGRASVSVFPGSRSGVASSCTRGSTRGRTLVF